MQWARYITCATTFLAVFHSSLHAQNRVPDEVRYKSGHLNASPKPADFNSAMLWGIAIADPRVAGFENAAVEVARVRLTCRVGGKDVGLNDDSGTLRGGLYRRFPWFGTDEHDPLPVLNAPTSRNGGEKWGTPQILDERRTVSLRVGTRPDRVWHFWAASPRARIPSGKLDGCTVVVRAKISRGALLQVGFDYWRDPTADYGSGGNNHEAGASNWYFPSDKWQDATFSNIKK